MNDEVWLNYVLMPNVEYNGSIRALQAIDIISEVLDHAPEGAIPNIIRLVLGKELVNDTGEVTEHTEGA